MSRQSTKNKKYALRKIGKYFGSCVVATVITLGGVAMMAPNVTVYASDTFAAGEADIENITSASDGYEVFVPKGKKYERDDKVESHEPVLREKGYNGRSFIVKADESENLTKEDIDNYFSDNSMESLFEKLYDKDDNDQIDEKYKRADADTINENAGKPIGDSNFVEPKVSEVNPKYPHRLDAGVSTPANPGNLYEGRPAEANGSIDSDDTIVESNNPITVNPNSEDNIVNDDGTVVLSKYYRIHVNKGEHADKKDDIYVVGTKPKVVETPIPYPTRYVEDNTKDKDYRETTQAGVRGKEITTTTYTLDPNTGTVTENTPTVVREEPTEEIITVGTKPKVVETPIPYTTRYVEDNTKDKDYRETTQTGVKGKETTTTTYTMDPNTGTVTENTPTVVREEPTEEIITVGTKPKVVETPIPYTTRYVEDNTKDKDYRETTQTGVKGKETTTTTYTMDPNTGTVTENTPTVVREEPTEEIITVGTKPKVVETPIPYTTRYVEDNTKDKDYRETTQTGVKGKETTTTTYTMDPNTGTVTENTPTVVREEPTEEIITVGTKPKVVETPIPYTTRYVEDNTKDKDYRETTQAGVKGKETTTTTYTMDPNTGTVTENTPTVVREEPTEEIITVGTKPKVVETPIPYTTRYVEDNTKDKDYRETTQAGVKGKETTTTTYTMDPNTGTVTENTPTVVREEPTEEIITVGTKPKVVETPIPYTTRYVEDNTKDKDYRETTQTGVKGKETTTTTYTMDPNTGTVTENTPTVVREEPTEEIITVGTKPKVVETPIPYTTRYVEDNTKDKDYRETTQTGVKGKETTTTTYTMDPNTGTVTENTPTVVREEPTEEIITVGTKPKVVETPIPYPTRYVEDNTKDKDYRETTQTGVKGKETTTTTYTMDPNTGTVTENTPTVVREEPTEEIITVGTKPKVVETPENPQPEQPGEGTPENPQPEQPGETPENPQPKPGETPETPQPEQPGEGTPETPQPEQPGETPETPQPEQPGEGTPETPQPGQPTTPEEAPAQPVQPSEGEDQPDLKVAPPTIAIVEEPNKASFEVKAPKKDADTVKIIYPKSNGSGNEVLTLTKQPTGEWTLDKQPENVTLDKKTGTVTIPRESVVNKQKVQAQAKHKTSDYTPFVYAALSIEAANPEHPVTLWVDTAGKEIKEKVVGKKVQAGEIAGYKWLSSRLEEGILTHTFEKVANGTPILPESPTSHPMTPSSSPSTSTPEKPNKAETPAVRTVWRDENGKDLKVPSVDKEEAGEVPGYEFVESHREGDNLTVHVFRIKQAQTPAPKDQTPSPAPSKVSEQKGEAVATATSEKTVDSVTSTKTSDKAELPNTGTESNASLASAGIMTLLAGLGLGFFKKKED